MYLNSNNDTILYGSEDLLLTIYLIGYRKQGESAVILLKSGKKNVVWSGVIDSYCLEGKNITYDILSEEGIGKNRKLDLACLSHFHEDHATDFLNVVNNFADDDTKILVPEFSKEYFEKDEHDAAKKIRNYIRKRCTKTGKPTNNLFYNRSIDGSLIWNFNGSVHGVEHRLCITSLLPQDQQAEELIEDDLSKHSPNELSLFVKIVFDKKQYLFTGDCTNREMRGLENGDLRLYGANETRVNYLKIPHHGSDTAENLLKMIENGDIVLENIATCTYDFRATNHEILDRYRRKCDVFVTKNPENKESVPPEYGIIKHTFDSLGSIVESEKPTKGTAIPLWRKS